MSGLMVTPRLIEMVRKMNGTGWWTVTNDLDGRFQARPVSPSVAKRLISLDWVEVMLTGNHLSAKRRKMIQLNETGLARAAEFDALSEANAQ